MDMKMFSGISLLFKLTATSLWTFRFSLLNKSATCLERSIPDVKSYAIGIIDNREVYNLPIMEHNGNTSIAVRPAFTGYPPSCLHHLRGVI